MDVNNQIHVNYVKKCILSPTIEDYLFLTFFNKILMVKHQNFKKGRIRVI